jgi:transposase
LVLDQAGWHTGKEVQIPEGIHLEFLPARSPELQPAERLWPLANEAVANRLLEDLDQLEEALVERCVALLEQTDLIRTHTLYYWSLHAA